MRAQNKSLSLQARFFRTMMESQPPAEASRPQTSLWYVIWPGLYAREALFVHSGLALKRAAKSRRKLLS